MLDNFGVWTGRDSTYSENLNRSNWHALEWFQADFDHNAFSWSRDGGNRHVVTVLQDGDYFMNLTVPVYGKEDADVRFALRMRVVLNESFFYESGSSYCAYIRADSSHGWSSLHLSSVAYGLSANDELYISVQGFTDNVDDDTNYYVWAQGSDDRTILCMERLTSNKRVFYGTATETTGGTNLNQSTAYALKWTERVKNDGFTHSDVTNPENVILDSPGYYLVTTNVPLELGASESNTRLELETQVLINGTTVSGGYANQSYIRNAEGHDSSSNHWSGIIYSPSASGVLTSTISRSGYSGTVTCANSDYATLFARRIPSQGVFISETTTVTGSTNINVPSSATPLDWTNDILKDDYIYTHTISGSDNSRVYVNRSGLYLISLNIPMEVGSGESTIRLSPNLWLEVNSSKYLYGYGSRTGYMRNDGSYGIYKSLNLTAMINLNSGDNITFPIKSESYDGVVNTRVPGRLCMIYTPYMDWLGSFSGYVYEDSTSTPVSRKVGCFRRDTMELIRTTESDSNGYYSLSTSYSGSHFITALDDDGGVQYNAARLDYMTPIQTFP